MLHTHLHESVSAFLDNLGEDIAIVQSNGAISEHKSYKCRVTWRLLVECCKRIKPNSIDVSQPPDIRPLGKVFHNLWPETAVHNPDELSQSEAYRAASYEINEYRQWFLDVRKRLESCSVLFSQGNVSIVDMYQYQTNLSLVNDLYRSFLCQDWGHEEKLAQMLLTLVDLEGMLNRYMVYPAKGEVHW